MGSTTPSVTPPRRYQRTGDLLVEDVQKDDEWLYSPSTEPSPVVSTWDDDAPPHNLRTSFDRAPGGLSHMERSNSLRGKLGLEPRSSSRNSSQSVTPQARSPGPEAQGLSEEDLAFGLSPRLSEARFQDPVVSPEPKQTLFELRTMFRDDHAAREEAVESTRRLSAPSPIEMMRRSSSNIPTPPGHAPPPTVAERNVTREPTPSIIERSQSAGSRIPFAPGARRTSSGTPPTSSITTAPSPQPSLLRQPSPQRFGDGGASLDSYQTPTPETQRPGYTAMQARAKAGLVQSPSLQMPQSGSTSFPRSTNSPGNLSPRVGDGASPRSSGLPTPRRASFSPARNTGRLSAPGQLAAAVSSPGTPGSASRMSSAGSFSGRAGPPSSSGNLYMTPTTGGSGKMYMTPSQTGNRSVNQPAKSAYGAGSTRSLSMGSTSKAGFNSSVPRTFTFLEDPTPKRRGSALEREEMASLTQQHPPPSPGGYLFPDEESPRRPVADTNDQSWAHVRTAVAQVKRSRSMSSGGASRDGAGPAKTASRTDPLRNSGVRSSAERSSGPRLSGGLHSPGQGNSFDGGAGSIGSGPGLLPSKRNGSSGNLAGAELGASFASSSSANRASYFPGGIPPPVGGFQAEDAPDVRAPSKDSDDESWGPGEGSKDGSVSGESGPWTGSVASEDDEEVGQPGKKAGGKKRRRFRKSRSRFRGTESGVEGDESEIDVDTASLATAGSPMPGNLMHLQDLGDTASDTMSADGGNEARGSDRLLGRGGRRDGVEVLEPLPDVSIDAEEGVLARQDWGPMEGRLSRTASGGDPWSSGVRFGTPVAFASAFNTRDGQSQTEEAPSEKEPALQRLGWDVQEAALSPAANVSRRSAEPGFTAAAAPKVQVGFEPTLNKGPSTELERFVSALPEFLAEAAPVRTVSDSDPVHTAPSMLGTTSVAVHSEQPLHAKPFLSFEETPITAKGSFPPVPEGAASASAADNPAQARDTPVTVAHFDTQRSFEETLVAARGPLTAVPDSSLDAKVQQRTLEGVAIAGKETPPSPQGPLNFEETPIVAKGSFAVSNPPASGPFLDTPRAFEDTPAAGAAVPAVKPPLSFEETPIVAKASAYAVAGPVESDAPLSGGGSASNQLGETSATRPGVKGPGKELGATTQATSGEALIETTAVQKVGMGREGSLPKEKSDEIVVVSAPAKDATSGLMSSKAGGNSQPAAAETKPTPEETPLPPFKPPVLSFDDIPVRGVQGIFSERPPVHSPPPLESPPPAKTPEKRPERSSPFGGPVNDIAPTRPSPTAQDPSAKQGFRGERRIRSAGGGAPASLGLRAGGSGANLEKAIASMNRRNTMRRSSDRSTGTGPSENFEWERSSMADETYSDISTPSTMLSRKTLEEAAETAIFCSSIVHDVVYQAASLAQEKEDLAKLGKASGELVQLVSKQRGQEIEKGSGAGKIGTGGRNDGRADSRQQGRNNESAAKSKKQPGCGCTIL